MGNSLIELYHEFFIASSITITFAKISTQRSPFSLSYLYISYWIFNTKQQSKLWYILKNMYIVVLTSLWSCDAIWCHRTWLILVQVMFVAQWYKAITRTNVDLSSMRFYGIHLRAASWEMLQIAILDISLKIMNFILQPHLPGANELIKPHRTTANKLLYFHSRNELIVCHQPFWCWEGCIKILTLL